MPGNAPEMPLGPLRTPEPKGQGAFLGIERVFFTGPTGLIGTAYGVPGITVTRTGTGAYNVTYKKAHEVNILPGVQVPSGFSYGINMVGNNPSSGTAQFNITSPGVSIGSAATAYLTMTTRQANPTSGTIADLWIYVAPITRY